jgi:hypothetical protein
MVIRRDTVLEIVQHLPEDFSEARTVLKRVGALLDWLEAQEAASGGSRPSLRAIPNDRPVSSPSKSQRADKPGIFLAKD